MLFERLAVIAARHGFERFQASTLTDNTPMLEVFRDSGFEIRSKSSGGAVDLQLSLTPSAKGVHAAEERDRAATAASLRPMLAPAAVAVVGASRDPSSIGRRVLDALRSAGFKGPIYPVNANAAEVDGLACYRSARALPPGTDLAIVAVPSRGVLDVVDDCAAAGVKSLVVITAGFAEIGDAGRALQQQLVERVRNFGMRMVGPNCMGLLNASPEVQPQRLVLADHAAARAVSASHPRAARWDSRFSSSPGNGAWACRPSSASATRPMCRATTCSSTGRATRPRA